MVPEWFDRWVIRHAPQPPQMPALPFPVPTPAEVVEGSLYVAKMWFDEQTAAAADLRLRGTNGSLRHADLPHCNLDDAGRRQLRELTEAALRGPAVDLPADWPEKARRYAGVMLRDPFAVTETPRPVPDPTYAPRDAADWYLEAPAAGRVWQGVLEVLTPDGPRVVADRGRAIERFALQQLARAGWSDRLRSRCTAMGAHWNRLSIARLLRTADR